MDVILNDIFNYWVKEIFPKAFKRAFKKLGVWGIVIEFIIPLAGSLIYFGGENSILYEISNIALITIKLWVILLMLTWLLFILIEPIRSYREMENDLKKWEEPIKAIEKIIPKKQDIDQVGLTVINGKGRDIENCTCTLKSVSFAKFGDTLSDVKEELNPAGQNFTWSLGQGERVTIGRNKGEKLVNLARFADNNIIFNFVNWTPNGIQGYYQIEIAINGDIDGIPIKEEIWCGYIWFQKFRSMGDQLHYHDQYQLIALPPNIKIAGISTKDLGNIRFFIIDKGELPEKGTVYKK